MAVAVGRLQHRITLQTVAAKDDFDTSTLPQWSNHLTCYAAIDPLTAKETDRGDMLQRNATHTITIRYRAGITEQMRILHGTKIFHIAGVVHELQDLHFLRLHAIDTGETTS